jgi:hypothetical protein
MGLSAPKSVTRTPDLLNRARTGNTSSRHSERGSKPVTVEGDRSSLSRRQVNSPWAFRVLPHRPPGTGRVSVEATARNKSRRCLVVPYGPVKPNLASAWGRITPAPPPQTGECGIGGHVAIRDDAQRRSRKGSANCSPHTLMPQFFGSALKTWRK